VATLAQYSGTRVTVGAVVLRYVSYSGDDRKLGGGIYCTNYSAFYKVFQAVHHFHGPNDGR
jgi:hypothetical protein